MKYYMVIAKCGHVGKNNYFKGELFFRAENGKEAAFLARKCPRVKHDQKDAILEVAEIDFASYEIGRRQQHLSHYYTSENIQEQRMFSSEIEENVFMEEKPFDKRKKYSKKHSLKKVFNFDPDYELMKHRKNIDCNVA